MKPKPASAVTRPSVTLSNVQSVGYSCGVTGTPPCRADAGRTAAATAGPDDIDPEARLAVAGRMGAAVVLSEQLDVLVVLPPVDLVLDAIVREVDLPIEVRQVVLVRPLADFVLVAVRTAVAVGASAVVLLQELLILALQVLLEDDAPNLGPVVLVPEPCLLLPVGRIEIRVVVNFAVAAHARVERL